MEFLNEEGLSQLAKKAREDKGLTQALAAKILNVQQPTLAQAENNPKRKLTKLRIRIIQEFTGYKVEGPFFMVIK